MSRSKKKRTDSRSAEKAPDSQATDGGRIGRWRLVTIISVFLAIIGIVVWVTHYFGEDQRYKRINVIVVDDTSIGMDYFLKRTRISGADAMAMLDTLAKEQIIKIEAPQYVGEPTEEDIDETLRKIASGGSGEIPESEFKEWYRQQLNETGLSDAEFRDFMYTSLLATRLQEYLADRMPTVGEHVHVHTIMVQTYDEAAKVRERWEEGEDFADLAREVSLDEQSREKGGDLGWMPKGVDELVDYAAFDLNIGDVSEPVSYAGQYFYLFMVSEREVARQIDEEDLEVLMSKVLNDWLNVKSQEHEIAFHGSKNGFDNVIYAWVNLQLAK